MTYSILESARRHEDAKRQKLNLNLPLGLLMVVRCLNSRDSGIGHLSGIHAVKREFHKFLRLPNGWYKPSQKQIWGQPVVTTNVRYLTAALHYHHIQSNLCWWTTRRNRTFLSHLPHRLQDTDLLNILETFSVSGSYSFYKPPLSWAPSSFPALALQHWWTSFRSIHWSL